eukprot:scaffold1094_cov322-Prasinococcus_capsulatus_cf.AAC.5
MLPRIASNAEKYGVVTEGTMKGVPICGCLGDQHAALLGQRCLEVNPFLQRAAIGAGGASQRAHSLQARVWLAAGHDATNIERVARAGSGEEHVRHGVLPAHEHGRAAHPVVPGPAHHHRLPTWAPRERAVRTGASAGLVSGLFAAARPTPP